MTALALAARFEDTVPHSKHFCFINFDFQMYIRGLPTAGISLDDFIFI